LKSFYYLQGSNATKTWVEGEEKEKIDGGRIPKVEAVL